MIEALFISLGMITTFSNRVTEVVKARLKSLYPAMPPQRISEIALLTSLVAGIFAAFFLNVNLLLLVPDGNPWFGRVPAIVGVIVAGLAGSILSEGVQFLLDLTGAKRDQLKAAAPPPGGASITEKTEKTTVIGEGQPGAVAEAIDNK